MPEIESEPKETKLVSNRGFVVDLIFNFPQGVAVDKESYVTEILEHIREAFNADKTEITFDQWLKQTKK
jgi:hypothetical protein